jgi:hypothetical protein
MSNGKIDDLLEAFDEKDDEKFKELIKNYLSYAVDNEVLKLANSVIKSEEWLKSLEANKKTIAPPPPQQQQYNQPDFHASSIPESHVKPSNVNLEVKSNSVYEDSVYDDSEPVEKEATPNQQPQQQQQHQEEDEDEFDLL